MPPRGLGRCPITAILTSSTTLCWLRAPAVTREREKWRREGTEEEGSGDG
jgi:hypothetical protein